MSQSYARGAIGPTGPLGPTGTIGPVGPVGPGLPRGTGTLNFGTGAGSNVAVTYVTGVSGIQGGSVVHAIFMGDTAGGATGHNETEHQLVGLQTQLVCSIPTGTQFTVTAVSTLRLTGPFTFRWFWV